MDAMISSLGDQISHCLRHMWIHAQQIEMRRCPEDAARRIEKLLNARTLGGGAGGAATLLTGGGSRGRSATTGALSRFAHTHTHTDSGGAEIGADRGYEPLPGAESIGCEFEDQDVAQLASYRANLLGLAAAAARLGRVVCFNREYNMEAFVLQRTAAYFELRLHELFVQNDAHSSSSSSGNGTGNAENVMEDEFGDNANNNNATEGLFFG